MARLRSARCASIGCDRVIVVTDFEARDDDLSAFCNTVQRGLENIGARVPVKCCVAHRMIENWFLADLEEISQRRNYIRGGLRQKDFEGTHGKKVLKTYFVKGYTYNEVDHGKELMATIRLDTASANSASLRCFLESLE